MVEPVLVGFGLSAAASAVAEFAQHLLAHLPEALVGHEAHHQLRHHLPEFYAHFTRDRLPPNHDLARAARHALSYALLSFAAGLQSTCDPTRGLLVRTRAYLQRGLRFESDEAAWRREAAAPWLKQFRALAEDDERLEELEAITPETAQRLLASGGQDQAGTLLHGQVRAWAERHMGKVPGWPAQWEQCLEQGWSIEGQSGQRVTLYQAWCLHFREAIKKEPNAFRIFVATQLADLLPAKKQHEEVATAVDERLRIEVEPIERALERIEATLERVETKIDLQRQTINAMARGLGFEADDRLRNASLKDLLAAETLQDPQQRLLDALLDPHHERDPDSKSILAAIASPVTGIRSYLLHRYARGCRQQGMAVWLDSGEIALNAEFVDPQLHVRPLADESPAQRFDSLGAALLKGAGVDAWVLAGDAGGGKTTLLRNHEMETIRRLLTRLDSGASPDECELCFWIRLASYRRKQTEHEQYWPDCETWLRDQCALQIPGSTGLSLPLLRKHFQVRFLLDGINEIEPSVDTSLRHQAMLKFREWVDGERRKGHLAPVFSVRRHDRGLAPVSNSELTVQQVDLVRWSSERIAQFCQQGGNVHDTLWENLKRDPALLTLCQIPFNLAAHRALHDRQYPVSTRADLFLGLVWLSLKREYGRGELSKAGLLTSRDLQKISHEEYWRMQRLPLPTEGPLLQALEGLAKTMVHKTVAYKDAQSSFHWPNFDDWLKAVQGLGLVEVPMGDHEKFEFAHPLWQDFFVALHLLGNAEAFTKLETPTLQPLADELDRLNGDQTLPKPGAVKLEEAVKLAVQLDKQPDHIIDRVAAVNLQLAGRALATCRAQVTPATLERMRTELLRRSEDARVDVRLRIEAAEALGLVGDLIRYEEVDSADGTLAPCPIRKGDTLKPGQRAGWISVQADDYTIGSPASLPDLDPDEAGPDGQPLRVRLSAFDIAFAPVTNAEYVLFIQAGGYNDDRWWPGEVSARWKRGELRDDEGRRWQMSRYEALVEDFEDGMNRFFRRRDDASNVAYAKALRLRSRAEVQQEIDSAYPCSGEVPAFMDVPGFGNPLQPVVGLSLFEAEAYCRWLSAQCGTDIRLPTEAEWEVAVRGRHRREWPWGDEAPGLDQLNANVLRLQRPSPIGVFPLGNTPEGMVDAAGNVWEWTASAFTADSLRLDSVNGVAAPEAMRTVRGGAYHFAPEHCRSAYRFRCHPLLRHKAIGFRIVRETSGVSA